MINNVAGEEQTDIGLNQRTGLVEEEVDDEACDILPSYSNSINPLLSPLPTPTTIQKCHR